MTTEREVETPAGRKIEPIVVMDSGPTRFARVPE
jgi:hypothetical protein